MHSFGEMVRARFVRLALLASVVPLLPAPARGAQVMVFGDHVPATFRDGSPFQSPFTLQWKAGDPVTTLDFRAAPGLDNPLGTFQWGQTAFGKYLLSGTFGTYNFVIVARGVEDLRINVLDSETKQACMLDLSGPAQVFTNATTRTLVTANPGARQSRIYVGGQGYMGYIEADLDNPDPCSWNVVQMFPLVDPDGFAMLWHDDTPGDPYGRDYLVWPSWWGSTQSVLRIDASGVQFVDTYVLPRFSRPGQCLPATPDDSRPCYEVTCPLGICAVPDNCRVAGQPVQVPQVDQTRPMNDRRWVSSLEMYWNKIPPATGACGGYVAAQEYRIDLTSPNPTIVPTSPVFQAGALGDGPDAGTILRSDPHPVSTVSDSQGGIWKTLWRRKATPSAGGAFYPTVNGLFAMKGAGQSCTVNDQTFTVGGAGAPVPGGEHCYYDPAHANDMARVHVDKTLALDHGSSFGNMPFVEPTAGRMYVADHESVQRARLVYGSWALDAPTTFKIALPRLLMPSEPRYCSDGSTHCVCPAGTPADQSCQDVAHCGTNATCTPRPESDFAGDGHKVLIAGGSPPSLWLPQHRSKAPTAPDPMPRNSLYWSRIPLRTSIPDAISSLRPALAWSGARLWLVAEHGGGLGYRTRDDGIWSAWGALPGNVAIAGGVAAVSDGDTVELFARGAADGRIYATALASAIDCTPGACAWAPWQVIPGNMVTDREPAAVLAVGDLVLLVRKATTGGIQQRRRIAGAWKAWKSIGAPTTNDAPGAAWHPAEGKVWVAVRDAAAGSIQWTRVTPGGTPEPWSVVSPASSRLPWLVAPVLAFDGQRMHVVTSEGPYPQYVYESVYDGGWTSWERPVSEPISTRQPAAVAVNDDVNLVTNWLGYQAEMVLQ